MSISVIVFDNQELIRMGYRLVLGATADIEVIGEATSGLEAIHLATRLQPDVVLLDTQMPNVDGLETMRQIFRAAPASHALVLTTFDIDEYALDALQAGASGFLPKDVRPDDLTAAIRVVAAGEAVVSPRITRELLNRLGSPGYLQWEAGSGMLKDPLETLTPREREVFMKIAAGHSNAEIADLICTSEATVKTHVTRLLNKLDLRDRVQAVIYRYENCITLGV